MFIFIGISKWLQAISEPIIILPYYDVFQIVYESNNLQKNYSDMWTSIV